MSTKKTKAPSAGEALVASILADLAEQDMAPDSRETELLKRASAAADKLERLEAALAETGLTKNPSKVRAGQASWQARSAGGDLRGAIARG
jgi:hypothetical protein